MLSQLKLIGGLAIVLVILAVLYLLLVGFFRFGAKKESAVKINGQEIKIEVVDTALAQARGLSGRDPIGDDEGMLFVFGQPAIQNFWMKDMKFAIDIIWIKDKTVVGFAENVVPESGVSEANLKIYSSPEAVERVLEMKAGSVQKLGIQIGAELEF